MGDGKKKTKRIVREVIHKIVVTKQRRKQITLSSTKEHKMWQHHKYMVHMESQDMQ